MVVKVNHRIANKKIADLSITTKRTEKHLHNRSKKENEKKPNTDDKYKTQTVTTSQTTVKVTDVNRKYILN